MKHISPLLLFSLLAFISTLKIPFTTFYYSPINTSNNFETLFFNNINSRLCFGSHKQCLNLNIELQNPQVSILGSEYDKETPFEKYNEKRSDSFTKGDELVLYRSIGEFFGEEEDIYKYTADECSDKVEIEGKDIDNFYFLNVKENTVKPKFVVNSGIIGLDLRRKNISEKATFIRQLKNNNLIDSDVFYFEYTDKENGNLIIGEYPHQKNKQLNEDNIAETYAQDFAGEVMWGLNFEDIKYNGTSVDYNLKIGMFSIESGYIVAPSNLRQVYLKTFFSKYIKQGLCKEETTEDNGYEGFSCDDSSKINFKELQPISFYQRTMNFTFEFTYEDLFYSYQGRKYFRMCFQSNEIFDTYWFLGKPFFQKYNIFFKTDSKRIGVYKIEEAPRGATHLWLWIVTSMLIVGLLAYIVKYILIKPRRKRAFELEDTFDYIPTNI